MRENYKEYFDDLYNAKPKEEVPVSMWDFRVKLKSREVKPQVKNLEE